MPLLKKKKLFIIDGRLRKMFQFLPIDDFTRHQMDMTAVKKMKDDVSESFSGLSSGVNGTISEFTHFITMMDPYIESC